MVSARVDRRIMPRGLCVCPPPTDARNEPPGNRRGHVTGPGGHVMRADWPATFEICARVMDGK